MTMATPDLNPERTALQSQSDRARAMIAALSTLVITTPEMQAQIAAALAEVKGNWQRLDDREKLITKPALESIKSTRALFAEPKASLEKLEELFKTKLADYSARLSNELAEAQEKAQALASAGDMAGAAQALATIATPAVPIAGLSERHSWKAEVINIDLLPREYLLANLKAIGAEQKRQTAIAPDETPVIPGVKFTREIVIASKST